MAQAKIKKRPIIALIVLLAVGGGYYWSTQRTSHKEPTSVFYGNVDVRDVTLAFRVAGRVARVLKTEGDQVEAGEVIAVLDKVPFELALRQTRATALVADAQVANIEAGSRREDISQARAFLVERKAALSRAEDTLTRLKRLEESGAVTTQSLVDAESAVQQNKAAVEASQASLTKLVNGARSEEIKVAHAQAEQAQTSVALAELNLSDTELKAQTAGVVVTRAIEPGTMVQPGSPAMVVSFESPVWIRAYAQETELARLAPGTRVQVISDARPDKPYEGRVGYVSPQAEFTPKNVETPELRTSLVYRFRVIVEAHDGGLRQGMPVTVLPPKGT